MKKLEICAEISANHLGSLDRALSIVDAAVECGADLFKLQTWMPDTMVLRDTHMWRGQNLQELYRQAWLPWNFHKPIFEHCEALGIECFSTPFDKQSVDFLETLNCPRYKIASFEIVDLELMAYAARLGKPMIISTGMASWLEIQAALSTIIEHGCNDVTVLKCTSAYPADPNAANLSEMPILAGHQEGHKFGLSDHTMGIGVAIAAAALGASYIEKHFTLSCTDGGADALFSMEPKEFKQMVVECRRAAVAVGEPIFNRSNECVELRRSLHYSKDLEAGHVCVDDDFCTARPADGCAPSLKNQLIGTVLAESVKFGDPVLLGATS